MIFASHLTRRWRYLVAISVGACWIVALSSINVVFNVLSRLVPPGTVLSEADRIAIESRSPYTTISRGDIGRSPEEIVVDDLPDGPDGMHYRTVYRSNGVVTESFVYGDWKPMRRLRVAAIAGALGGVLCFLAWRHVSYPLIALSIGCAVLHLTTKPFNSSWLVDALKERDPAVSKGHPVATVLPTGLGGRVESNNSQGLDAFPSPFFIAWRIEYFLNGYCADTKVHAYAVQAHVKLCRMLQVVLATWQLILVIRIIPIGRLKLSSVNQSPGAEGDRGHFESPPTALRLKKWRLWRWQFWMIASLVTLVILAWQVKVLDAKLTEMRIHILRMVTDVARGGRMLEIVREKSEESDLPSYIKRFSEGERQSCVDFLNLLTRRGLIERKDADRAMGVIVE